ncbi:girdin-like [Branchiostoma floridae]|uniref:Girdin-like n=1 Tax=Branchiostoma floridae TaxID=7739 RepID=A0A9J7M2N0_BRAFL|nr:girdin-like [Branchiostoma floridae]
MTRMQGNDLNRPGTTGNIPVEKGNPPDGGWGWLMGFIIPVVVPPLFAWIFHAKGEREKEEMEKEYQCKIDIFHDNQMKMKDENSKLFDKLASKYKVTANDQHYISKLEDAKKALQEDHKKQQEQIHQLKHKENSIQDNLTNIQEENSRLMEKLMIHHKVRERDHHYISKLEEENQKVKKDNKEQLKQIYQVMHESGSIRDKLTKIQEENSKLQETLANQQEFKAKDQQYISKLEEDNQTLKKVYKEQQEQMNHLEHKSSTILEKLAKMQEENFRLNEKLASHRDIEKRDHQYISKLEDENKSLKQDYKKQQEELAKRLSDVKPATSNETESPEEVKTKATGTAGTSGFTLKDSLAFKQREKEIHVKEEYLSKLKQQLRERQDMKCGAWNPMKTSWHRVNLEQQMLAQANINVHARSLRVPAALREIFKYDDYCATGSEDHGRLMWTFWRQWKMEVEREKNKLLAERLAQDQSQ